MLNESILNRVNYLLEGDEELVEGFLGNEMFDKAMKNKTAVRFPVSAIKNFKCLTPPEGEGYTPEEFEKEQKQSIAEANPLDSLACANIKKIGPFYSGIIGGVFEYTSDKSNSFSSFGDDNEAIFKATIINNSISNFVVQTTEGAKVSFSVDMKNFKLDVARSKERNEYTKHDRYDFENETEEK